MPKEVQIFKSSLKLVSTKTNCIGNNQYITQSSWLWQWIYIIWQKLIKSKCTDKKKFQMIKSVFLKKGISLKIIFQSEF